MKKDDDDDVTCFLRKSAVVVMGSALRKGDTVERAVRVCWECQGAPRANPGFLNRCDGREGSAAKEQGQKAKG